MIFFAKEARNLHATGPLKLTPNLKDHTKGYMVKLMGNSSQIRKEVIGNVVLE